MWLEVTIRREQGCQTEYAGRGEGVGRIVIGFGERLDLIFKVIGKLPEGT